MTIRNLQFAFTPTSVAVIGASPRPGSVGAVVLGNIIGGGFTGAIYPVNPKHEIVAGVACYRRVQDLPMAPDVAVIVTPAPTVPGLIAELGERGTKVAVVITAGIGAADDLRQKMLDAAKPHLMRIIGPNTIGLLSPRVALNASFVHLTPALGRLGLISQSGAMVSSIIDWAAAEGIGFSEVLSLGDMADVDVGDALNMLAADEHTSAILMYLESIPAPRKFMSAARAAARIKPVIAVKPGRHEAAAKAARTHTGALAGADRVVDAALRRAGIIRVQDLDDLFDAAAITARFAPLQNARVAIVTNGGGAGVLAVDQIIDQGCSLASLTDETLAALDTVLPSTWSHANPVDIIGDAPSERYKAAVELVARDPGVDALLVMNCPTALASPEAAATAVATVVDHGLVGGKPVLSCWLGKQTAEPARAILNRAGIASLETPAAAADAIAMLTRWSSLRRSLERVPASAGPIAFDRQAISAILAAAAHEGRSMLTEAEAKAVISASGIPVPEIIIARSDEEIAAAAGHLLAMAPAIVVKLVSRTVSHKSDVGGVVLDIVDSKGAVAAAAGIKERLRKSMPGAELDGFALQPMIRRPHARELILGIHRDPNFGPTILFGAGGTAVEVVDDIATGLVPLDDVLAGDLIDRTRIVKLLRGYRDEPAANRDAIITGLLGLSQLAVDFPAILSIDVNPLLADAAGVIALDARIEIDPARVGMPAPNPDLALRPYPSGWERPIELGPRRLVLRPMRPSDATLYPAFLRRVTAEDLRLRFLTPLTTISPELLIRLTQLDYDRDIAFAAIEDNSGDLAGIVRYSSDPDHQVAEFGLLVRSDLQGLGLGTRLMHLLMEYGKADGLKRLDGLILAENARMIALCRELGFGIESVADDLTLVRASMPLSP